MKPRDAALHGRPISDHISSDSLMGHLLALSGFCSRFAGKPSIRVPFSFNKETPILKVRKGTTGLPSAECGTCLGFKHASRGSTVMASVCGSIHTSTHGIILFCWCT